MLPCTVILCTAIFISHVQSGSQWQNNHMKYLDWYVIRDKSFPFSPTGDENQICFKVHLRNFLSLFLIAGYMFIGS